VPVATGFLYPITSAPAGKSILFTDLFYIHFFNPIIFTLRYNGVKTAVQHKRKSKKLKGKLITKRTMRAAGTNHQRRWSGTSYLIDDFLMIIVDNITKRFRRETVLSGISFSAEAGKIIGILGANGAGKSTLLSILAGILRADAGDASLDGVSLNKDSTAYREKIGYVSQEIALFGHLSGRDNLRRFGGLRGLFGKQLAEEVERAAKHSAVESFWDKQADRMSGGMQRRIHLACGLLGRPTLLILDEPTVGLDLESRKHIEETIRLVAADGTTVLMANHQEKEIERLCDLTLMLKDTILCDVS
jgi:ABC-type multidrug transport system ATPase subunit